MKKTVWWLRTIGVVYLLLVAMNVIFIATDSSAIRDGIPYEVDANGVTAFVDAWGTFVLALFAYGCVALYASTKPGQSRMLVIALIAGEAAFGVGGDLWLIARGYDAAGYIAFSVVHLAFIVTGILLLRGQLRQPDHRVTTASEAAIASR